MPTAAWLACALFAFPFAGCSKHDVSSRALTANLEMRFADGGTATSPQCLIGDGNEFTFNGNRGYQDRGVLYIADKGYAPVQAGDRLTITMEKDGTFGVSVNGVAREPSVN